MVKLYDSLSRQLVELKPKKQFTTIYSCGPTVYDYPHIGNWYAFLRWDLLVRTLRASGINSQWVMNITDVGHLVSDADSGQDKLALRAEAQGKTAWQIASYYSDYFQQALQKLNFSQIDVMPKATEHIEQQIDFIKKLEQAGFSYQIDDGLYFDSSKLADYGKLTHKSPASLNKQQARIEANSQKRHPADFALWKLTAKGGHRDMEWDSPWGRGFPGWHIECSAMSRCYLGQPIDIHTGGIDHIPVHHSNEIAQSEAAYGCQLARIWLHCNFITVEGQKMSKSLNNFYTLEDIGQQGYLPEELRLAVLASHYATAADFSWQLLDQARLRLRRWQSLASWRFQLRSQAKALTKDYFDKVYQEILAKLGHNLNSPEAISRLDQLVERVDRLETGLPTSCRPQLINFLAGIDQLFGLTLSQSPNLTKQQTKLLKTRAEARASQAWSKSDRLRQVLAEQGVLVRDVSSGQFWSKP